MQVILQTLLTGLHRLEYRGYDSAGLAITEPNTNKVTTPIGLPPKRLTADPDLGSTRGRQRGQAGCPGAECGR